MTPWWVLLLWVGISLAGLFLAVRLAHDARRDLEAARREVAAGRRPSRIVPLGERHVWIMGVFVLAFMAQAAAGLLALARASWPGWALLIVPALIAANALFMIALVVISRARREALAAAAEAEAQALVDIHDAGRGR